MRLEVSEQSDSALLLVPFADMRIDACRRITELSVAVGHGRTFREYEEDFEQLPGHLAGLLSKVEELQTLELAIQRKVLGMEERAVLSAALAPMSRLTRLTLQSCVWLLGVGEGTARQLQHLDVVWDWEGDWGAPLRPETVAFAASISTMTSLRSMKLDAPGEFDAPDLLALLDAVPPSLERLEVTQLRTHGGISKAACSFTGGSLSSVDLEFDNCGISYGDISVFLAEALLPSRALGPRLGRLTVRTGVELREGPLDPDPAAPLYARCDQVQLSEMWLGRTELDAVLAVAREIGVPRCMAWSGPIHNVSIQLGPDLPPFGDPGPAPAEPVAPPRQRLQPLPLAALTEAVARCMAAAGGNGKTLLLRGPGLFGLLTVPEALKVWMQRLSRDTEASFDYRALPAASAVVVACGDEEGARRLAQAVGALVADSAGAGAGAAPIEATPTRLSFHAALDEVLQALWDGAEAGAGEAGAQLSGGGWADAGSGGQSELERLECLLDTMRGLEGLPRPVHVRT
ncbi:hypothetical protein HYH03_007546 [Edaphochlamys debaryana]|uniref:Uncharacterized protein n=1 Tax=Edaphochlamys debaryana TaxID=47281 RepID=A0A836C074_9CHLO|nr:hypothetical protein HYH03_007546 [Edaphochlamys debaryana]|eukprot:KAG2494188.1 hypothetical protein HYH03_007546 [Edaphochlamys debaryana]